ncbi:MAG: GvpL/GvpF family gas vesicle protein [Thermostichales cyanobacterium DRC_bins_46]
MLYTFAFFCPPPQDIINHIQQIQGFQGSLEVYGTEEIAVAVEGIGDVEGLQRTDQALLRAALVHDQVIQGIFAHVPVLPVRFGTCFPTRERLMAYVREQGAGLAEQLRRLGDRAEYVLKIQVVPPPSAEPTLPRTGTDYLLARRQQYLQQQRFQDNLQVESASLEGLWSQEWEYHKLPPQEQEWGRYVFLLTPEQAQRAQGLTQAWQQQHPHWHFLWGPPLPPYHWTKLVAQ